MPRSLGVHLVGFAVAIATGAARHDGAWANNRVDRDRDGLDDAVEAALAVTYLPQIHEYASKEDTEECSDPSPRPVLYRARPRIVNGRADVNFVALTYVLLYVQDCGALGHVGDNEAFTVFMRRDTDRDAWRRLAAVAVAHSGTAAARRSVGSGDAIWVSRGKHSNYATFDACGDGDLAPDQCAADGPAPKAFALINVGEPWAPLTNDVGDVMLAAGARPRDARALAPWFHHRVDDRRRLIEALVRSRNNPRDHLNYAYLLFEGHTIWNHQSFLEAGDITAQLLDDDISIPAWSSSDTGGRSPPR